VSKIPIGIKSDIPAGVVGLIWDRSSMGANGWKVMGGVIDPDYRGEWWVMLYNFSDKHRIINAGVRVAQVIFHEFGQFQIQEVDILPRVSQRGEAGFGSTGA
jgi:dUTP pyrophosphatase